MATDRFGQPIITRALTGATRTPFADSFRQRYGRTQPSGDAGRFNVDFSNPSTSMRYDSGGGTMTRAGGGNLGGMWRSPSFPGNASNLGTGTTYPAAPGAGGVASGDAGRFNQPVNDNVMRPYQPGVQPHPAPTLSPVERGRYGQDFGAMPMTPINNLTPRFDPTQENPWGRAGNLNQGLHGLLAQLLGRGGGRY